MAGVGLLLVLAGMIVFGNSFTTMRYVCSECASDRQEIQVRPFGMRSLGALTRKETSSKFTTLIQAADPGPCAHRWVFSDGSGGAYA